MKKIGIIGSRIIHSYGYGMHLNRFNLEFAENNGKAVPQWQLDLMKKHPDTEPIGGASVTHVSGGPENVPEDMAGTFGLKATKTVEETIDACDLIMIMDEQINSRTNLIRKALKAGKYVFADKLLSDNLDAAKELIGLAKGNNLLVSGWSQMGFCAEFDKLKNMDQGGVALISYNMKPEIFAMYGIHIITPMQVCFPGRVRHIELISKDADQLLALIINDNNTKIILSAGEHAQAGVVRIDYAINGQSILAEGGDRCAAFRRAAKEVVNMAQGSIPVISDQALLDASMIIEEICK
jgi:hypothetical protein